MIGQRRIAGVMTGILTLAIYACVYGMLSGYAVRAWAAEGTLLADKHKNAGIPCEGCHKEDPPKEKVATATCMKCHGNYAKLAERTQKLSKNPHESHQGELECEKCHNSHKPSTDFCGQCHNFGLKVP